MKVKAFFPILNIGQVNIYGMEGGKITAGLQIGNEKLDPDEFWIRNDEKDNSLYIYVYQTRYYLNWFTAVI